MRSYDVFGIHRDYNVIAGRINRLHIRWIEKELVQGGYDKETKFKIIDGIIKKLRAQEPTTA